jgi:serine/threonine protein kinase
VPGKSFPVDGGRPRHTPLFTILRTHAQGGLGIVSLARDEAIKREVALKQILPQHLDNPVLKRRFLYEAQITGQLEHPSIVPVYTLGTDEAGTPYYVMRFVKGRTLDEIIREHHAAGGGPNPIVFRELLRRFIAVCQAVAYAHSRGVIHRDLKPANIMLGDYGETLVLDWGLAKDIKQAGNDPALWGDATPHRQRPQAPPTDTKPATSARPVDTSELTMEGQIIGTPAYMAPEQAEGRTDLHAPVTDIYALGGILYKILTGQSPQGPKTSTTGSGARRFTFVASPPPSRVAKEVHPGLEAICLRAMAISPSDRFPRALELAQEIQRWLDEHPLSLKPRGRMARVAEEAKAHWVPLTIALAIVIAVLIVLLIVTSRT